MRAVRGLLRVLLLLAVSSSLVAAPAFSFNEDDFKEAKKAADNGDAEAELRVGIMYDTGQGVPQNFTEALKWYKLSANQGNAIAQNNLGVMYLQGEGVAQNYFEAAKWIQQSANQDYSKAEMNLGFMYADGSGVRQNSINALGWFRKAAEQGDPAAQRNLGNIYSKEKIVTWDYVEAYKWYTLAAAQGDNEATKGRDELADKMSPEGITEAQKRAAAFVPRKRDSELTSAIGSGTGFFITRDGYMLTANHVVEDAKKVIVKTKYLALGARVVKVDKTNDIALLKITGAYPPGALTNEALLQTPDSRLSPVSARFRPFHIVESGAARLGDSISTLGFPNPELQGSAPKFTRGEINSTAGIHDDPHFFQISAPVQPGNSGGPLLDRSGNVVGIILLTLNDARLFLATGVVPQNVNYALKSDYLLRFLKTVPGLNLNEPATPAGPATPPAPAKPVDSSTSDWVSDAQASIAVVVEF